MSYIINIIDETYLEDIINLNHKIFKDEIVYDKTYVERFCKLKQGVIIRTNNKKPIGYILYGMAQCRSKRSFTIISIGILNEYRGKGYGKLLMKSVIELYPLREIALHVRVTNNVAKKMYESIGFEIKDIEEGYYYQLNDDAYHMIRKPS